MSSRTIIGALIGAAALALSAGGAAAQQQKLKVGFIYVGPVGDHGWSYQHDVGRKAIEKAFGDKVETTYVESVPEADSERSIEQLARTGHGLIFTTSFGFMEPTLKVAKKYPNIKFEHATGFKRAPNLATYAAKFHEGRYVIGQIAGKMTKSGTIGYVGAFPIPEVVSGINSYFLGAQSVNPNIKLKVVWANSWYDPAKEADAAKALLDQGVDVVAQHTDSPAPLQAAEARGKYGFGQASDMERFAPKAQLTAIVDNWADYYVERTKAVLDGTWKSQDLWGGFDSGMVVMSPFKNMPDDVKKMAEETEAAIKSGKLNPFKCPVIKQDGSEVECKGTGALSDEQVLGMNFYVKGIDDKLPQ
ncbi:BMP family ABC transporter substrate-binding protein [Microvirga brassicacearum]|uniref:BMP family ABC transporter substrate-binding protein n=1 Tax=Microvirga brassicacearum TaxID=2580413 RepID=A0A5N3P8W3_9HYPH|nr:BMP family ABC transporter substrate-binding protein [Microvirga brassicacearum]KAB0266157.1 BMP family ABC transporter substrate-binding protein [Microvirga brassicacearum]